MALRCYSKSLKNTVARENETIPWRFAVYLIVGLTPLLRPPGLPRASFRTFGSMAEVQGIPQRAECACCSRLRD